MKCLQYQEQTVRTLASIEVLYSVESTNENLKELFWKADLAHMSLGLGSELNELFDANINQDSVNTFEELGDIYWYLSNEIYLLKYKFDIPDMILNYSPEMVNNVDISKVRDLATLISINNDLIKKMFAYRKDKVKPQIVDELIVNISDLQIALSLECIGYNFDEEKIMERNIAKLSARYPEKFTQEDSIDRDLDKERDILEGK